MQTLACNRKKKGDWQQRKFVDTDEQILLYIQWGGFVYHIIAEVKPIKYNHMYFCLLFDYKTFGVVSLNARVFFGLYALREITKQTVQ